MAMMNVLILEKRAIQRDVAWRMNADFNRTQSCPPTPRFVADNWCRFLRTELRPMSHKGTLSASPCVRLTEPPILRASNGGISHPTACCMTRRVAEMLEGRERVEPHRNLGPNKVCHCVP